MNAVVVQDQDEALDQQEQQKQLAIASVKTELSHVITLPVGSIVDDVIKYALFGKQAVVQAEKAVVKDEASLGLAGDLMKAINANIKALNEARTGHTTKLDALKKYLMGLYGAGLTKLEAAKTVLQSKQNVWLREEAERKRLAAIAEQKRIEAEALERAQVQASLGDEKGADQVMEEAASLGAQVAQDVKVSARGVYGASVSGSKRWVGKVTNAADFIAWLAGQKLNVDAYVDFKQIALNKVAKEYGESGSKLLIPGFTYEQDISARSR